MELRRILVDAADLARCLSVSDESVAQMVMDKCPQIVVPGEAGLRFYPEHVAQWLIQRTVMSGVQCGYQAQAPQPQGHVIPVRKRPDGTMGIG